MRRSAAFEAMCIQVGRPLADLFDSELFHRLSLRRPYLAPLLRLAPPNHKIDPCLHAHYSFLSCLLVQRDGIHTRTKKRNHKPSTGQREIGGAQEARERTRRLRSLGGTPHSRPVQQETMMVNASPLPQSPFPQSVPQQRVKSQTKRQPPLHLAIKRPQHS